MKVAHFAQANLLVGRRAVPEFFQADVRAEALGGALLHWLTAARAPTDSPQAQELARLRAEFAAVHAQLRCNGAALAAAAVVELLGESP